MPNAGGDGDIGEICHPELVGTVNLEVPGDERIDRSVMVAVGGAGETPPFARIEIMFAHQTAHFLAVDEVATMAKLGPDASVAGAFEDIGDRPDLGDDLRVRWLGPGGGIVG